MQLLAQTSYKGVLPGSTTRSQVEHAFGEPVNQVSSTLSEYEARDVAGKIYVQFRSGANVVERVELIYQDPNDRSRVAGSLKLPSGSTASQVNAKGKREEYYAAACIVLTFAGESVEDGVSRVGYYSRELFDGVIAKFPKSYVGDGPRMSDARETPPPRADKSPPKVRETTTSTSSGSTQMTERGGDMVSMPDLPPEWATLKNTPAGGTESRSITSNNGSDIDLRSLTGTFEFSSPDMARQKSVKVEDVGGKLRWSSQAFTDMLVATGTGAQNDSDGTLLDTIYIFKFANKPGIKLQFFVRNGRTRQVVYFDSSAGQMGAASMGFPKR